MKKHILTTLLLVGTLFAHAQHITKVYYDKNWKVVKATDTVAFYTLVKLDSKCKALDTVRNYSADGKVQFKADGALYIDTLNEQNSVFTGNAWYYYKSGSKKSQMVHNDKGAILSNVGWYEDGKFMYTVPYVNGKKEGTGKTYYRNGAMLSEMPYANDQKSGIEKIYYSNGDVSSVVIYANDMQNGSAKSFYEGGQINQEAYYVNDSIIGTSKSYYKSGKLKAEVPYTKGNIDGTYKTYYENGLPKSTYDYVNGKVNGYVILYWENKLLERRDKYINDKIVEGKCYDSTGKEEKYYTYYLESPVMDVFTVVQKMPVFKGDMNGYLSSNIKYPAKEKQRNITGTVYVNFIVEKDGTVNNVRVLKGVANGPGLDAEAVRVISSMPAWTPGLQNGLAVRVSFNIPIRFVLN